MNWLYEKSWWPSFIEGEPKRNDGYYGSALGSVARPATIREAVPFLWKRFKQRRQVAYMKRELTRRLSDADKEWRSSTELPRGTIRSIR